MDSALISEIILFLDFQESFSLVTACFGRTLIYILSERGSILLKVLFFFDIQRMQSCGLSHNYWRRAKFDHLNWKAAMLKHRLKARKGNLVSSKPRKEVLHCWRKGNRVFLFCNGKYVELPEAFNNLKYFHNKLLKWFSGMCALKTNSTLMQQKEVEVSIELCSTMVWILLNFFIEALCCCMKSVDIVSNDRELLMVTCFCVWDLAKISHDHDVFLMSTEIRKILSQPWGFKIQPVMISVLIPLAANIKRL